MKITRQTDAPLEHLSLHATNRHMDFFVHSVEEGRIILDAPYQRGRVWTVDQQIALVRSWLEGVPIPALIINDRVLWPRRAGRDADWYSVIDGQQRILTAVAWMTGELAVPASWFPAGYIVTTEETDDGPYVRHTGLTRVGQRFSDSRCVLPCAEANLGTIEEEARVYLLVNGGGTQQTASDMARAAAIAETEHCTRCGAELIEDNKSDQPGNRCTNCHDAIFGTDSARSTS